MILVAPRLPLGLGRDLTWGLDNLTGVIPAGTPRKPPDTPAGTSPKAAEQVALAALAEALNAVLEGRPPKKPPLPREQASRSSPLLGPSEPKSL